MSEREQGAASVAPAARECVFEARVRVIGPVYRSPSNLLTVASAAFMDRVVNKQLGDGVVVTEVLVSHTELTAPQLEAREIEHERSVR